MTTEDVCYHAWPFFHVDAHVLVPACLQRGPTFAFRERFSVRTF
ncbi:hypothetical protein [Amycolatopsis circi]|nr:hypothetical protein [Amycolatopsis circi]